MLGDWGKYYIYNNPAFSNKVCGTVINDELLRLGTPFAGEISNGRMKIYIYLYSEILCLSLAEYAGIWAVKWAVCQ